MSEKLTTDPSILRKEEPRDPPDRTDWDLLRNMSDAEAEARARRDPDAPPTDGVFWQSAQVVLPPGKTKVSLYLDRDVLAWFKAGGKGYQTRMNAVLRAYVSAQSEGQTPRETESGVG